MDEDSIFLMNIIEYSYNPCHPFSKGVGMDVTVSALCRKILIFIIFHIDKANNGFNDVIGAVVFVIPLLDFGLLISYGLAIALKQRASLY
jgi:hypothetical protein